MTFYDETNMTFYNESFMTSHGQNLGVQGKNIFDFYDRIFIIHDYLGSISISICFKEQ